MDLSRIPQSCVDRLASYCTSQMKLTRLPFINGRFNDCLFSSTTWQPVTYLIFSKQNSTANLTKSRLHIKLTSYSDRYLINEDSIQVIQLILRRLTQIRRYEIGQWLNYIPPEFCEVIIEHCGGYKFSQRNLKQYDFHFDIHMWKRALPSEIWEDIFQNFCLAIFENLSKFHPKVWLNNVDLFHTEARHQFLFAQNAFRMQKIRKISFIFPRDTLSLDEWLELCVAIQGKTVQSLSMSPEMRYIEKEPPAQMSTQSFSTEIISLILPNCLKELRLSDQIQYDNQQWIKLFRQFDETNLTVLESFSFGVNDSSDFLYFDTIILHVNVILPKMPSLRSLSLNRHPIICNNKSFNCNREQVIQLAALIELCMSHLQANRNLVIMIQRKLILSESMQSVIRQQLIERLSSNISITFRLGSETTVRVVNEDNNTRLDLNFH